MKDNIIVIKSFDFAVQVVETYKALVNDTKNLFYQNGF
ncbi:Uncharacterised protein [Clostridium tertium]|uniref:Uncharacterized protein n=1 Tax=Clostridium tertium TaxID=1559 RepID=A0A6N3GYQ3_9CLOT